MGKCDSEILGAKLPSIKQVLQVFFYKMRVEKSDVKQSVAFAIDLVIPFWQRAHIPILAKSNCVKKLEQLYDEWKALKKNTSSKYEVHRKRETEFREKIEDFIFDIAVPDALDVMKILDDKDFLIQQRQKGRPGSMLGIDKKLAHKEKRKLQRMDDDNSRKQKNQKTMASSGIKTYSYSNRLHKRNL